ncbi:MAG: FlgD immunoglobulin-like domain containing protein [Gemmatimonadota bacterium]|nr:FlgD immunoglobulin-like domain containing protein [Gemmatimonadota bacterium]
MSRPLPADEPGGSTMRLRLSSLLHSPPLHALLLSLAFSPAAFAAVTPISIGKSGQLHALAYSASDPDVLYTGGDMCGVFRTTDHGSSWHLWAEGIASSNETKSFYVEEILDVAGTGRDGVYAATYAGLYLRPVGAPAWVLTTPPVSFSFEGGAGGSRGAMIPFSSLARAPGDTVLFAGAGYGRWDTSIGHTYYPVAPDFVQHESGPAAQYSICTFNLSSGLGWEWDESTEGFGITRQLSAAMVNGVRYAAAATQTGIYLKSESDSAWARVSETLPAPPTHPLHPDAWGVAITSRGFLYALFGQTDTTGAGCGLFRADVKLPSPEWEWIGSETDPVAPHSADSTWTWLTAATGSGGPGCHFTTLTVKEGTGAWDFDEILVGERRMTMMGGLYRTRVYPVVPGGEVQWEHCIHLRGTWSSFTYHYLDLSGFAQTLPIGWNNSSAIVMLCQAAVSPVDSDRRMITSGKIHATTDGGDSWDQVYCDSVPDGGWVSRGANLMTAHSVAFLSDGRMVQTNADEGCVIATDATESAWNVQNPPVSSHATPEDNNSWTREAGRVRVVPDFHGPGQGGLFTTFGEIGSSPYNGSKIMVLDPADSLWKNATNNPSWDITNSMIRDFVVTPDSTIFAAYWRFEDHPYNPGRLVWSDMGVMRGDWDEVISSWYWTEVNDGLATDSTSAWAPALRRHGKQLFLLPGTTKVLLGAIHWSADHSNSALPSGVSAAVRGGLFCLDSTEDTSWAGWLVGSESSAGWLEDSARDVRSIAATPDGSALYVGTRGHSTGIGTLLRAGGGPFVGPGAAPVPADWTMHANEDGTSGSFGFDEVYYRNWTGLELERRMTNLAELAVHPDDPDVVFAGMAAARYHPKNGVWMHRIGTGVWTAMAGNGTPPLANCQAIGFDTHDSSKLVYGTNGEEWWQIDISEMTGAPETGAVPAGPVLQLLSQENPVRGTVGIRWHLARRAERVTVDIHDVSGRRVRRISREPVAPGEGQAVWDARDQDGVGVAAGVYFLRVAVVAEGREIGAAVGKVVLMR